MGRKWKELLVRIEKKLEKIERKRPNVLWVSVRLSVDLDYLDFLLITKCALAITRLIVQLRVTVTLR